MSVGYTVKLLKNWKKNIFHTIALPQKTNSKIVSMIVHGKDVKKQNSKIKNSSFVGKDFHKNLSQRLYHWGTRGREKNSKLQRKIFHEKSIPQKNYPKNRIKDSVQER